MSLHRAGPRSIPYVGMLCRRFSVIDPSKRYGHSVSREDGGTGAIDATDPPLSRASSLPQGIWVFMSFACNAGPIVGASLLAMAAAQSTSIQADPPLSRAGSLPQGMWGFMSFACNAGPIVGASLLAMAAAQSTSIQADPPLSRAGSLPQGMWGFMSFACNAGPLVGASLLAMAAAQSTSIQADSPLSRAGSLPQGIWVFMGFACNGGPLWERACSRWRRRSQHRFKLTHRFREQARSHRGCGGS